ncbi:unnamed protein product [Albugo candida]|uniref:Uncharacterized protein n=1 Tax=Albugo candida TaxID=65357 RepID=A0A024GJ09_9STRA|nr:unnamed protein product [Albugo candida]|eukprot:CCI46329.1 unnamed protein product [Albugo candida]
MTITRIWWNVAARLLVNKMTKYCTLLHAMNHDVYCARIYTTIVTFVLNMPDQRHKKNSFVRDAVSAGCPDILNASVSSLLDSPEGQKHQAYRDVYSTAFLLTIEVAFKTNTIDEAIKLDKVQLADAIQGVFHGCSINGKNNEKEIIMIKVLVHLENVVICFKYEHVIYRKECYISQFPTSNDHFCPSSLQFASLIVKYFCGSDYLRDKYGHHLISCLSEEALTHFSTSPLELLKNRVRCLIMSVSRMLIVAYRIVAGIVVLAETCRRGLSFRFRYHSSRLEDDRTMSKDSNKMSISAQNSLLVLHVKCSVLFEYWMASIWSTEMKQCKSKDTIYLA